MSSLAFTLVLVTALFALLVAFKKRLAAVADYCAICVAVSVSWVSLLVLFWLDSFDSRLIIAVLMGQSVVGFYYLLEKRAVEQLLVFRLPVLLTLTIAAVGAVQGQVRLDALAFTVLVWLAVGWLYAYRNKPAFKGKVQRLIECCSNW